jgi:hypothetical protein
MLVPVSLRHYVTLSMYAGKGVGGGKFWSDVTNVRIRIRIINTVG